MKVLIATEKPFAPTAVAKMKEILEEAGISPVLLEKYQDKGDQIGRASCRERASPPV